MTPPLPATSTIVIAGRTHVLRELSPLEWAHVERLAATARVSPIEFLSSAEGMVAALVLLTGEAVADCRAAARAELERVAATFPEPHRSELLAAVAADASFVVLD